MGPSHIPGSSSQEALILSPGSSAQRALTISRSSQGAPFSFPSAPSSSFLYRPAPPTSGGRMVISTPTSYHSPLLPASHKQIHSFQSIDLRKGWTLKTNLFFGIGYLRGGLPPPLRLPPAFYLLLM